MFLRESLKLDPDSPNSLMSLAVTYHLDRQMEKERPLLERYLDIDTVYNGGEIMGGVCGGNNAGAAVRHTCSDAAPRGMRGSCSPSVRQH